MRVACLLSGLALLLLVCVTAPASGVHAVSVIRKIEHRLHSKAAAASNSLQNSDADVDADTDTEARQSFLDHKLLTFDEGKAAGSQGSYQLVALTDKRMTAYGKVALAGKAPYAGLSVQSNRNGIWVLLPDPREYKSDVVSQHLTINHEKPKKGPAFPHISSRDNKKSGLFSVPEIRTLFYYRPATANAATSCPSCGADHANDPADVKVAFTVFPPFGSGDPTPLGATAADITKLKALFKADASLLSEWEKLCAIMSAAILDQKDAFF